MSTENRRNFLRSIMAGGVAAAVAKVAPAEPAPVKIVTVERAVLKDIPNNVSGEEMEIWLKITAERRNKAWAEKRKAKDEGRYF